VNGVLEKHPTASGAVVQLYAYTLPDDWTVWVGRTERDNDLLSLQLAHPEDYWFHVRSLPGSHVVLRAAGREEPPRDILRQAAALAAWHSKARKAGTVPVSCTRVRHVGKAKGAPAGQVQIRRESVIKTRPGGPENSAASSSP